MALCGKLYSFFLYLRMALFPRNPNELYSYLVRFEEAVCGGGLECESSNVRALQTFPTSDEIVWTEEGKAEFEKMQEVSSVFYVCNDLEGDEGTRVGDTTTEGYGDNEYYDSEIDDDSMYESQSQRGGHSN